MTDERSIREQHKRTRDRLVWTAMVAGIAAVAGVWLIDAVEARYACIDRLHWLAQPEGVGDPPSPTPAYDPTWRDYAHCLM